MLSQEDVPVGTLLTAQYTFAGKHYSSSRGRFFILIHFPPSSLDQIELQQPPGMNTTTTASRKDELPDRSRTCMHKLVSHPFARPFFPSSPISSGSPIGKRYNILQFWIYQCTDFFLGEVFVFKLELDWYPVQTKRMDYTITFITA